MLDRDYAGRLLADAVASRLRQAEVRAVHRELSALRSAIGWWRHREWIAADPTSALAGAGGRPVAVRVLTEAEVAVLFRAPASLREQALWHLLRDCGAAAETVLRLDASGVDLRGQAGKDRQRRADRVERS